MKLEELRHKLEQDRDHRAAEKELEPFLQLADEVLRLRIDRGWSQSELARRAGTGQTNISRIESGLANPTLRTIQAIAQAFGVDLEIRLGPRRPTGDAENEAIAPPPAEQPATPSVIAHARREAETA